MVDACLVKRQSKFDEYYAICGDKYQRGVKVYLFIYYYIVQICHENGKILCQDKLSVVQ